LLEWVILLYALILRITLLVFGKLTLTRSN
jgi:hypothetical protein